MHSLDKEEVLQLWVGAGQSLRALSGLVLDSEALSIYSFG